MIRSLSGLSWLRKAESTSHKAQLIVELRPAGETEWLELPAVDASVELSDLETIPSRTAMVQTLLDGTTAESLPWGSYFRIYQDVTFPAMLDPATHKPRTLRVPYGIFRLETATPNNYGGLTLSGMDAGQMVVSHEVMSLAESQLLVGNGVRAKLEALLTACWPAGVPRWSATMLDAGGVAEKASKSRVQYDDDRAVVCLDLAARLGAWLQADVDGSSIYKLRPRTHIDDADPVAEIRVGPLGNLISLEGTISRSSIVNRAQVLWEETIPLPDGKVRVEQRRTVVELLDDDSLVSVHSSFGIQSTTADTSSQIETEAQATAAAKKAMSDTLLNARDFTVSTSPVYGLEVGDVVMCRTDDLGSFRARVVGGSIGLTPGSGAWNLRLRSEVLMGDMRSIGTYRTRDSYEVRDASVRSYAPVKDKLSVTLKRDTGWSITGGSGLRAIDGALEFTATASEAELTSAAGAILMPPSGWLLVKFSTSGVPRIVVWADSDADARKTSAEFRAKRLKSGKSGSARGSLFYLGTKKSPVRVGLVMRGLTAGTKYRITDVALDEVQR